MLTEVGWLCLYAICGALHSLWIYDEDDSSGMIFVDFVFWPVPFGAVTLVWLWECMAAIAEFAFALFSGEEDELLEEKE